MKKYMFLACCALCLSLSVMAGDNKTVSGAELSKITFEGDKVVLHYTNGTTETIEDMSELVIDMSTATGIEERKALMEKHGLEGKKVYNLRGQYLGNQASQLQKGVYIINGKKVVIK